MAPVRYPALDVLRGIAILGTLGTNIWIFTHPQGLIGYLSGTPDSGWRPVELVLQWLTQGKSLGLLTVMFGIGLALQQASARRAGRAWPGSYPWRAALLLLDGIVHFLLMTEFDVLMGYAVTGWIVAYLLVTAPRVQWRVIAGATAVHMAMLAAITAAVALAPRPDSGHTALEPNPYADGSWWDLVIFRLDNAWLFRLETMLIFPLSIALFLLGARLFDAGVLDERGATLRRRLMVAGFGVALPLDFALEFGVPGGAGLLASRYGTAPVVALGVLALVAEWYHRRPDRARSLTSRRLTEVGRMALSSYVLQNLVASALCYGWGLGVAAATPAQHRVPVTIAIYIVVIAIVMTFAHVWLRRYDRGPVEWLWNTTYRAVTVRSGTAADGRKPRPAHR
jgi:uncharacterized protein